MVGMRPRQMLPNRLTKKPSHWTYVNPGGPARRFGAGLRHAMVSASRTAFLLAVRKRTFAKPARPQAPLDRKSTRLNSSHDQISYAVFCLKKDRSGDVRKL